MDLPKETEEYIKESIGSSLGLPVSAKTLALKLLASEDSRHRLQDKIFVLEERLQEADKRLEKFRAEASMNAQGVKRCIEEKEMLLSAYGKLENHCGKLEKECSLYERDLEKVMESCDELGRENEELRARIKENSDVQDLAAEIESLKKDKDHLRVNLHRAEEEVKVLFEENRILDEENTRILELLRKERHYHQGSDIKRSASTSAKGKRKSSAKDCSPCAQAIDFSAVDSSRQPLSPLHHNSPDSKMHKK